jgi:putative ABC transport system permease protein
VFHLQEIHNTALLAILLFIFIPIFVSYKQALKLEKDILWSSLRGFVQLLLLGYFISYIFSFERWYVILGYVLIMVIAASMSVSKRGIEFKRTFLFVFLGITVSVSSSICLWLMFHVIPFQAQYIIPVAGMFSGTAMVASGVVLESMKKEESKDEKEIKRNAIKIAMIPTIDTLKTMGLVQIPGTMTGMILAGAEPIAAVKYQIFIVFTLLVVASISSIIVCILNYRTFYKSDFIKQAYPNKLSI